MTSTGKSVFTKRIHFPDWELVLNASINDLDKRDNIKITIRWYLSWCKTHGYVADANTARSFLNEVKLKKQPADSLFENWRNNLRWFFDMAVDTNDVR